MAFSKETDALIMQVLQSTKWIDDFINKMQALNEYNEYFHEILPDLQLVYDELSRLEKKISDEAAKDNGVTSEAIIEQYFQSYQHKTIMFLKNIVHYLCDWLEHSSEYDQAFKKYMLFLLKYIKQTNGIPAKYAEFQEKYTTVLSMQTLVVEPQPDALNDLKTTCDELYDFLCVNISLYNEIKTLYQIDLQERQQIIEANLQNPVEHITKLPDDIRLAICGFLPVNDLGKLNRLSKNWYQFMQKPRVWATRLSKDDKEKLVDTDYKPLFLSKYTVSSLEKTYALPVILQKKQGGEIVSGMDYSLSKNAVIRSDSKLPVGQFYLCFNEEISKIFTADEIKQYAYEGILRYPYVFHNTNNNNNANSNFSKKYQTLFLEALLLITQIDKIHTALSKQNETSLYALLNDLNIYISEKGISHQNVTRIATIFSIIMHIFTKNNNIYDNISGLKLLQFINLDVINKLCLDDSAPNDLKLTKFDLCDRFCETLFKLANHGGLQTILAEQSDESINSLLACVAKYKEEGVNNSIVRVEQAISNEIERRPQANLQKMERRPG